MEISNAVLTGQTITIDGQQYSLAQIKALLNNINVSNSNTNITNASFHGEHILIDDVSFSMQKVKQILNEATAWNENISYQAGTFVSYDGKWYVALQDNTSCTPADDSAYWQRYRNMFNPVVIDESTTLAPLDYNHEYVVTLFNDTVLTLPQGKAGQMIKVSAQYLNEGKSIKIQPYTGDKIGNENELYLDISYSSVELVCTGTNWVIVTPFAPMTNTMLESAVTNISGTNTLSLYQNGEWKMMTLDQLKTFLGLTT